MKRKLLLPVLAAAALLASSCSTSNQLAQNNVNDDVYNTAAVAKEAPVQEVKKESDYRTDEQVYGDNVNNDSYYQGYYDGSYASRISRFRYGSPYRSYYDSWYANPYGYYGLNAWSRPGLSLSIGLGSRYFYDPFFAYGGGYFYNNYYYGNSFWGLNSYNNYFPGYSYGGGFYSPGNVAFPDNSRTRPGRDGIARGNGFSTPVTGTPPASARPQRGGTVIGDRVTDRISSQPTDNSRATTSRPTRTESTRTQNAPVQRQPDPVSSRPERSQPVSQPSSSPSSSPSSAPSSSGSSSRPSRGGR